MVLQVTVNYLICKNYRICFVRLRKFAAKYSKEHQSIVIYKKVRLGEKNLTVTKVTNLVWRKTDMSQDFGGDVASRTGE